MSDVSPSKKRAAPESKVPNDSAKRAKTMTEPSVEETRKALRTLDDADLIEWLDEMYQGDMGKATHDETLLEFMGPESPCSQAVQEHILALVSEHEGDDEDRKAELAFGVRIAKNPKLMAAWIAGFLSLHNEAPGESRSEADRQFIQGWVTKALESRTHGEFIAALLADEKVSVNGVTSKWLWQGGTGASVEEEGGQPTFLVDLLAKTLAWPEDKRTAFAELPRIERAAAGKLAILV